MVFQVYINANITQAGKESRMAAKSQSPLAFQLYPRDRLILFPDSLFLETLNGAWVETQFT